MKLLFANCCIRGERSRTLTIARAFIDALDKDACTVDELDIMRAGLAPLDAESLAERDALLAAGRFDAPRFAHARAFATADVVLVAAPFWDLTYPALLKIYIENISVQGITFDVDERGMHGLCRGSHMVFVTTRGGIYEGSEFEHGSREMASLSKMFGFDGYSCIAVEGTDIPTVDIEAELARAKAEAADLARRVCTPL